MNLPYTLEPGTDSGFRPGHQALLSVAGTTFGVLGEVHPKVLKNFDIDEKVFMFEINLTALLPKIKAGRSYQPLPKYPAVTRDIALVLDESVQMEPRCQTEHEGPESHALHNSLDSDRAAFHGQTDERAQAFGW